MAEISFEELADVRKKHQNKKVIFCSGTFDLVHIGHLLFFEDCKKHGDILVVGVGSDVDVKAYKGDKRPILNQNTRLKTVGSIGLVDYVLIPPSPRSDDPLEFLHQVFEKLQPDTYIINDDAFGLAGRAEISKHFNIDFVVLQRSCPPEFDNISTTKIINRIKSLL